MSRLFCFTLVFSLALPSLVSGQEDDKQAHPQESIDTAIPHAIKLLEEQKYKEMIDSYVPPEELKKMKAAGFYEVVVSKFGEGEKVNQMIQALKEANEMKPEFNADKTVATYTSDKEDSPLKNKPMKFVKVDKRWYIK